jgi:hypothetical protein
MVDTKLELDLACEALKRAIEDDYLYNRFHYAHIERKGKTLFLKREGKGGFDGR